MQGIIENLKIRFRDDKNFSLFIMVGIFAGVAGGINNIIFSNFLNDVYKLSESARGFLELPREFPGLITVLVLGALAFMGNIYMASIGMLLAALGMVGLGFLSPQFSMMVIWLMIFNMGIHMYMPLAPSIGMEYSKPTEFGKRLALYSAFGLGGSIFGYAIVWVGFKFSIFSYKGAFFISAIFYLVATIILYIIRTPHHEKKISRKFVFKKKYSRYYILCLLYGARKQIFLTFAPWVLVKIFGLKPESFAILGLIIAVVSIGTRTIVGNAIDSLGERFVLCSEAVLLIIICFGYVFAGNIFSTTVAIVVTSACYVIDSSMSVVEMARFTYVKKLVDKQDEVTPTLATGTSIDHIFATTTPLLGGLLWKYSGSYQAVFIVAAGVALINLILSLGIKIDKKVVTSSQAV